MQAFAAESNTEGSRGKASIFATGAARAQAVVRAERAFASRAQSPKGARREPQVPKWNQKGANMVPKRSLNASVFDQHPHFSFP